MTRKDKFKPIRKKKAVMLSLALLFLVSVGMTMAYLVSRSNPVINKFLPSHVDVEIEESFDGKYKENVNVTNTGNTDAYIRIKLISYRVNNDSEKIGGTSAVPQFEPGNGWKFHNGFYYYILPVSHMAPNNKPASDLIDRIELIEYDDADGGKQVIEVIAEGIQNEPKDAVKAAWGIEVDSNGHLTNEGVIKND